MKTTIKIIKKPLSKKLIILGTAVLLALILFFAVKAAVSALHPPVIAFYGLADSTQTKLQTSMQNILEKKGVKYSFVVYDKTQTLKSQISKNLEPALVITTSGAPVTIAAEEAAGRSSIPSVILDNMTTSIKNSAVFDSKTENLKALPVLLSNTEIAVDYTAYRQSGMTSITTWNDILSFNKIEKKYMDSPIVFAAKESSFYLDLVGALTEALDGTENYKKAAQIMAENSGTRFNAVKTADKLFGSYNAPLYSAVEYLSTLYKANLLNPNSFSYSNADILSLMKARIAATVFMTFDAHRTVDSNTIKHFSTIYLPSDKSPSERAFTAPVIYAVKMKKSSPLDFIFEELVKNEVQETLSRDTGLAPVLARCRTPDHQADDVRYWIAATNPPLAGLSREADLTRAQKQQICDLITTKIQSE